MTIDGTEQNGIQESSASEASGSTTSQDQQPTTENGTQAKVVDIPQKVSE